MNEDQETMQQLMAEIQDLRQRVAELETAEAERKQAAEALANERNQLRTLIDSMPDYIFFKDIESRFVVNNIAHARVLRVKTPDDVVGKTDFDFFPPELAAGYCADEQAVMQSGQPLLNREERTIDPEGRTQWLLTTKVPLRDDRGKIIGLVGTSRDITARKQADEALRESEARLAEAQRLAHIGHWSMNLRTHELSWSDEVYRIFGVSPEEFAGTQAAFFSFVHPDDRAAVQRASDETEYGHKPLDIDHRIVRADGVVRVVHERGEVIFDEAGQPIRMLGTVQDITDRKRMEEALRESEALFRSQFEFGNIGITVTSPGKVWLRANPRFCEMIGYREEELLDKNWMEISHPDDVAADLTQYDRMLAGEIEAYELDKRFFRKDGSVIHVHLTVSCFRNPDRSVQFVIASLQDVTDRKRAEEALQRRLAAEELVAAISTRFINLPSGKIGTSIHEALRSVALAADADVCFLDLYDPDQTTITASYGGGGAETVPDWLKQAGIVGASLAEFGWAFEQLRHGRVVDVPCVAKLPADDPVRAFWLTRGIQSILIVPLFQDDRIIGSLGFHSLHREQSWPDEYRSLLKLVGHIVVSALARKRVEDEKDLLQAQFLQAQKMEAVGRLTAGVAHDFNNLLTVINGYAEQLQYQLSANDPRHAAAQKVADAGWRAADLTRQLLMFSRKDVAQPQIINVSAAVTQATKLLRRVIGEDIQLATVLAPDVWPVRADTTQLEQVIVNLAANARDAMPNGGQLTIEAANAVLASDYALSHLNVQPGEYVLLAVSDTGVGMTDQVKSHLFEPFFTTKEAGKGTGLGLATVYGIVKQSGGHIWVYSEPGQGSTFKIYLPRVADALSPTTPGTPEDQLPRGTETVLLVEDDKGVRSMCRHQLEDLGYRVLETRDAKQALEAAAEYPGDIQLLLTDVVMPGMNGKHLSEQLSKAHPRLKTLFVSGYTDNAIVHHGVLDNGVAFLQKPFSPTALSRKVRDVLDRAEGA
jgi:PAS domain S-box-containing protein